MTFQTGQWSWRARRHQSLTLISSWDCGSWSDHRESVSGTLWLCALVFCWWPSPLTPSETCRSWSAFGKKWYQTSIHLYHLQASQALSLTLPLSSGSLSAPSLSIRVLSSDPHSQAAASGSSPPDSCSSISGLSIPISATSMTPVISGIWPDFSRYCSSGCFLWRWVTFASFLSPSVDSNIYLVYM